MIIHADARALPLRDDCVNVCITSPPYYQQRDYGHGDDQLGLEPTVDQYVRNLCTVCDEIWRVLRADGTFWLNLGDTMAKDGTLTGVPWLVAFALMERGWNLQAEVIWSKSKGAPSGGSRRPLRTHEQLFMLTRSNDYFYNADAIREPLSPTTIARYKYPVKAIKSRPRGTVTTKMLTPNPLGRHKWSVWTIAATSAKHDGEHFAAFPEPLVEPCILASSTVGGLVLDPFLGSGCAGVVAARHGRRWVGTDLGYHALAKARTEAA